MMSNKTLPLEETPFLPNTLSGPVDENFQFQAKNPRPLTKRFFIILNISTAALWILGCFLLYLSISACSPKKVQTHPVHRDQLTYCRFPGKLPIVIHCLTVY